MTKADMIPKFLVLVLIIVGVGKERVGALPVVGAAEGLTLLGSQIYCGSRLGEDGSCLLALGPIGAHRKQLACLRHQQQRFWFLWVIVLINVGVVGVVGVLGVVRPAPSPAWKSVISSFHHLRCWS